MVQVNYDANADVLSIIRASKRVKESAEILSDVIADFDDDGRVVAFEILDASKVVDPSALGEKVEPEFPVEMKISGNLW